MCVYALDIHMFHALYQYVFVCLFVCFLFFFFFFFKECFLPYFCLECHGKGSQILLRQVL